MNTRQSDCSAHGTRVEILGLDARFGLNDIGFLPFWETARSLKVEVSMIQDMVRGTRIRQQWVERVYVVEIALEVVNNVGNISPQGRAA